MTALAVTMTVAIVVAPAGPVAAATITVTTTLDEQSDDGLCSLREAIINANTDSNTITGPGECEAGSGEDTIAFNIDGLGPHTIALNSPLPAITTGMVIDGYTQPDASPNTALIGSNATLQIAIDGSGTSGGSGLVINSSADVRGLIITGFDGDTGSAGIEVNAKAIVEGNFIGVAADGTTANPNNYGILVTDADDVTIGRADLAAVAARNLISGNLNDGVYIQGTSTGVLVSGNVIGLDRTGISAVPNLSGVCACSQLGGSTAIVGNTLSGNAAAGIFIASIGTTILRNFIGTDATGLEAVSNLRGGIVSGFDSAQTLIGDGTPSGRNIISGNLDEGGISLGGSTELGTEVRGNFIGVGADGFTPIGNSRGVWLTSTGATDIQIGGPNPDDGNFIANNLTSGVVVAAGTGTSIVGNFMLNHPDRGIVLFGNTVNDLDDEDAGPNNLQNWPTLLSATTGDTLVVEYSIDSAITFSEYPIQIDVYVADSIDGDGDNPVGRVSAPAPGTYTADLGPVDVMAGTPLTATATDAEGNTSEFSFTVTATAADRWETSAITASGPPMSSRMVNDGDTGPVIVGYDNFAPLFGGSGAEAGVVASVVADADGTVDLSYVWTGFHAFFGVTAELEAFVSGPGGDVTTVLRSEGPIDCCTPPSGGFTYNGNVELVVNEGDTYGFRIRGSNGDENARLRGTLVVDDQSMLRPDLQVVNAFSGARGTDTGNDLFGPGYATTRAIIEGPDFGDPDVFGTDIVLGQGIDVASPTTLIGTDIFVLGEVVGAYTADELAAFQAFVAGGGTLIATASGTSADLAAAFGIQESVPSATGSTFVSSDHEIADGPFGPVTGFAVNPGDTRTVTVSGPAVAVARDADGRITIAEIRAGVTNPNAGLFLYVGDPDLLGFDADDNTTLVSNLFAYAAGFSNGNPATTLAFALERSVETPDALAVAPSGIAVNLIDRNVAEGRGTASATVAASSITSIGVEDTALSSIRLGSTPLSAIVIDSDVLSSIPLVNIDIEGGWARVIAGTDLEQVPLVNLTFGRVLTTGSPLDITSPAGRVANTPLSAIDVEGTPLSAIPLSAIALGSTPLSAIPLSAIGGDSSSWCQIIANIEPNCDEALLQELTLMEVTLRGVPLSAIPLSAIPLSAIDLQASPLSAIPLSAIDLAASPLSAIPLSAIPLSAIDVQGAPLSAIPLSAIPLSAIPLSAIDLQASPLSAIPLSAIPLSAIPTSIPLSAIPLSAIDVQGTPLSAIQVQGAPLSAIPLSAIVLADTPLSAIPLSAIGPTDWCGVLSAGGVAFNCDTGVDPATTTLRELSVRGVPLSAIPLSAIPLSAIDVQGAPLSAIPLSAIPLSAIPLSAIPLSAIDVQGAPLSAIPLSAIDVAGSPLSAIPLSAIPLSAIPLSAIPLSAIPLSAIPLSAIPLSAIDVQGAPLSAIPLSAIDVISSPLSAIPLSAIPLSAIGVDCQLVSCTRGTLGDAVRAGAIPGSTTLSQIQQATSGIGLGELAPYLQGITAAELAAAIAALGSTLGDLPTLDGMQLGDLPGSSPELQLTLLGDLGAGLNGVTFDDLVGNLIDPATGLPIVGVELDIRFAINALQRTLGSLDSLGDVTLGDLVENGPTLTLADIEPLLGFLTVATVERAFGVTITLGNETLADLTADQLGQLTLGDLARLDQAGAVTLEELLGELGAERLRGFTLGDLLRALVDPSSLALGGVQFDTVNVSALPPGTVPPAGFSASFTLSSQQAAPVSIDIALPSTAAYLPGSTVITPAAVGGSEAVVTGSTLQWNLIAEPGVEYRIRFDVAPSLRLGVTSLGGTARVVGTDIVVPATAAVTVREGIEPNDFELVAPASTLRETTPGIEDVVYLTYISTPTDIDVFELDLADNDRLIVSLSNLDADLDVVLWRRPEGATVGAALSRTSTESPLFPIVDPDAEAVDAEPLADFPRLDALDPTLQLVAVSNGAGLVDEYLSTDRLAAGTYFVQVFGANGAVTVEPAALQLKVVQADTLPVCRAIDLPAVTTPFPAVPAIPADADTLILVNETRLEQMYGAAGRTTVTDAVDALTAYLTGPDGSDLGITPVVVPVDANAAIRAAYDAWDSLAGSCDVEAANAVVAAINAEIIDPNRDQFEHIMILGGDEIIPMARLSDRTRVANEYDYRHEFDGDLVGGAGRNAVTSSFWASTILSDEPYGEEAARSLGDRFLYVSDAALGRVVETPAEIADALMTYMTFDGNLAVETAAVLGYDFLVDGSERVSDELAAGGLPVEDSLADGFGDDGEAWDRDDATAAVAAAGANSLISLNAHFDHYRALPAIGDKVAGFDENIIATDLAADLGPASELMQSVLFSMGCHSGLSISDVLIGNTNADWPQMMGREGALYVGNTGFGYGDTVTVAYTEQLMRLFARQVVAPLDRSSVGSSISTVGQALTWAKNEFYAGNQTFSVYDEKALMESTFYGIPFYRIGLEAEELPATPVIPTAPDATGTESIRTQVTATNDPVPTDEGTYFANTVDGIQQVIVSPGRPIQPKTITDVSVVSPTDPTELDLVARGAIVLGQSSTYQPLADPVIATPIFDESASQPEPAVGDVVFPTKPLEINTVTTPAGTRQQLVVATGQYTSATATQRLDTDFDIVVYYSSPGETDTTTPTIGVVESTVIDGRLAISVTATDAGTGVDRIYVLVAQNPGAPGSTWTGIDLARVAGTDRWSGSLPLAPGTTEVEFIVQAKDAAGNVGFTTNKASGFVDDLVPDAAPPVPPADVLSVDVPTPPASGAYNGPVTVVVTASTSPSTVFVDGVQRDTLPAGGGSFEISGDGTRTWRVVAATGHERAGVVVIDTTDPTPRVDRQPGNLPLPTIVRLSGADAGTGIARIVYSASGAQTIPSTTVDGVAVDVVLDTAGTTTISLVVVDGAGNASDPVTFVYDVGGAPPVVTAELSSPPNAAGWHNTAVEVTWVVDDPAATVPPAIIVTSEGAGQEIVSAPSCDAAGNCATGSVTLSIDLTAPLAELATTPEAGNEFGWNNEAVTVLVTCGPDLSGVVCPEPIVVDQDVTGQRVAVAVVDTAGNVTSLESREINIDTVAPEITWNAPPDGSIIDETDYLRPTCIATDDRSGVNGACSVEVSEPVMTPGFAQYTATVTVTDRAGNATTLTSTYRVRTDLTGPVIEVTATPPANAAGWWNGPVTFSFACTDATGVTSCPPDRTVDTQGANQTFQVTATDLAGNSTPLNVSGINIDTTAPSVTVTAPESVGPLDTVEITCTAADLLSGIATATCADATFPAADLQPGANTLTFSATDAAGNTTTVTRVVTLVVVVDTAPIVLADMGVAGLEQIGFQSNAVVITGSFTDPTGSGPFAAAVRWTANGPFTPLILNNGERFAAAFLYRSAGTYTVTVRICDAAGNCGTDDLVVRTRVTQRVTPVRQCVTDRGAGFTPRYEARWGYNNPAPFAIAVPSIPLLENTFTSMPFLRGQPQIFLPGNQRDVFATPFRSGTQTWRLNGSTASASASSPRC